MSAPAINHWNPDPKILAAVRRGHRGKKVDRSTGLNPNIEYMTITDVADVATVKPKVVRYALAKGYLVAARRQPGRAGVLIHPAEAARWIEQRKAKEVRKC